MRGKILYMLKIIFHNRYSMRSFAQILILYEKTTFPFFNFIYNNRGNVSKKKS